MMDDDVAVPVQELSLHGNPLEGLPEELGRLSNLQRLQISACGLQHLPESLCGLTDLEVLQCHLDMPKMIGAR